MCLWIHSIEVAMLPARPSEHEPLAQLLKLLGQTLKLSTVSQTDVPGKEPGHCLLLLLAPGKSALSHSRQHQPAQTQQAFDTTNGGGGGGGVWCGYHLVWPAKHQTKPLVSLPHSFVRPNTRGSRPNSPGARPNAHVPDHSHWQPHQKGLVLFHHSAAQATDQAPSQTDPEHL